MPNSGTLESTGIEAPTGMQIPSSLSTQSDGNNNTADITNQGGDNPVDENALTAITRRIIVSISNKLKMLQTCLPLPPST
jgi:hypothetical protein